MGKGRNYKPIYTLLAIVAITLASIAIIVFLLHGNTTGSITVSGGGSIEGMKCTNTRLMHPVFRDAQPISHVNTITANSVNNNLSSIMYQYDGLYQSADEASRARVFAEADYNLILTNEYDAKIDVFSHIFMTDGARLRLTITSDADKLTSRTAPYFLLDTLTDFPNTLEKLQIIYEAKGFSCTMYNSQ